MLTDCIPCGLLARAIAVSLAAAPFALLPKSAAAQNVDIGNLCDRSFRIDGIDADLGSGGFRIDGIDAFDFSGRSVSGAGDVNGDGLADLIVGALRADPGGDSAAGESYVVFSASVPLPNATYRVRSRNGNPPLTAVGISGDSSNDSTPDARLWVDFADGNDLGNDASLELVTLSRSPGALPSPGALVSWRLQSNRQKWTSAEVRVRYLDSELQVSNENALQLVFSSTGAAPFTPLDSVVNPLDNTISAHITQPGFLYIGQRLLPNAIFANGFEPLPP
jgi:hypothetical protein